LTVFTKKSAYFNKKNHIANYFAKEY